MSKINQTLLLLIAFTLNLLGLYLGMHYFGALLLVLIGEGLVLYCTLLNGNKLVKQGKKIKAAFLYIFGPLTFGFLNLFLRPEKNVASTIENDKVKQITVFSMFAGMSTLLSIIIAILLPYLLVTGILVAQGYYQLNLQKFQDGIFQAIANSADDPHTMYFTSEEAQDFTSDLDNSGVGLGVMINTNQNPPVITEVFADGPADDAGLKPGDQIIKIDGTSTSTMTPDEIMAALKGEDGDIKQLSIVRDGQEMQVDVILGTYTIPAVKLTMIDDNAWIQVNQITMDVADEFNKALVAAEEAGATGVVLDLRNNGGGYLNAAVEFVNVLTYSDTKPVVQVESANGDIMPIYTPNSDVVEKDYPFVILVNQNTASAAEIIAIALNDLCGYPIVGTTTYGKGSVQRMMSFSDGSMLKYTTQVWLGPNDEQINGVGITPDYEVPLSQEFILNPSIENDAQLQKAIEVLEDGKNN